MKKLILLLFMFANINLYTMNKDKSNTYILKYLNARITAFILNIIQETRNEAIPAIQSNGNSMLLIKANQEDWERIQKLIDELDKPQPQNYIIDLIEFKEFLKGQEL